MIKSLESLNLIRKSAKKRFEESYILSDRLTKKIHILFEKNTDLILWELFYNKVLNQHVLYKTNWDYSDPQKIIDDCGPDFVIENENLILSPKFITTRLDITNENSLKIFSLLKSINIINDFHETIFIPENTSYFIKLYSNNSISTLKWSTDNPNFNDISKIISEVLNIFENN